MDSDSQRCAVCGCPAEQRCSRCKTIFYCSRQCQRSAWPSHRPHCTSSRSTQHELVTQTTTGQAVHQRQASLSYADTFPERVVPPGFAFDAIGRDYVTVPASEIYAIKSGNTQTPAPRNLLIMFHGVGDTCTGFAELPRKMSLEKTSSLTYTLVVNGYVPLPFSIDVSSTSSSPGQTQPHRTSDQPRPSSWFRTFDQNGLDLISHPSLSTEYVAAQPKLPSKDILSAVDKYPRVVSLRAAVKRTHELLKELQRLGWEPSRITLFGFGQGATLAMATALTPAAHCKASSGQVQGHVPCCRAVVAKSGDLILAELVNDSGELRDDCGFDARLAVPTLCTAPASGQDADSTMTTYEQLMRQVETLNQFTGRPDLLQIRKETTARLMGSPSEARAFFEFYATHCLTALEEQSLSDPSIVRVEGQQAAQILEQAKNNGAQY